MYFFRAAGDDGSRLEALLESIATGIRSGSDKAAFEHNLISGNDLVFRNFTLNAAKIINLPGAIPAGMPPNLWKLIAGLATTSENADENTITSRERRREAKNHLIINRILYGLRELTGLNSVLIMRP